ncbi:MAG: hypothetical protein JXR70_17565 [Spirochaetales bacterium]|nr:hypothetical protein [Spirochaetales bacterium]
MFFLPGHNRQNTKIATKLVVLLLFLFFLASCTLFSDLINGPGNRKYGRPHENIAEEEEQIQYLLSQSTDVLRKLFKDHRIDRLSFPVQQQFIERYNRTLLSKYVSDGSTTYCNVYFYDYFIDLGYGDILRRIEMASGYTMVEKTLNYAAEQGEESEIKVLTSAYDAQRYANAGYEVGVIGEYYYDKAESIYTRHYSVVQPSLIAYDNWGLRRSYMVYGLKSYRNDVNNRRGEGTFLSQVGVANGLVDFKWAYNRKIDYLIQRDKNGNIRGGIIFVVFPS